MMGKWEGLVMGEGPQTGDQLLAGRAIPELNCVCDSQ